MLFRVMKYFDDYTFLKNYIVNITCKNQNLNQNDILETNVRNIKFKGQTFSKSCTEKTKLNNNSAYNHSCCKR